MRYAPTAEKRPRQICTSSYSQNRMTCVWSHVCIESSSLWSSIRYMDQEAFQTSTIHQFHHQTLTWGPQSTGLLIKCNTKSHLTSSYGRHRMSELPRWNSGYPLTWTYKIRPHSSDNEDACRKQWGYYNPMSNYPLHIWSRQPRRASRDQANDIRLRDWQLW